VGDDGGLVGVALAVQQIDAVEADLGVSAGMVDPRLDPLATRAEGQDGLSVGRAGGQVDLGGDDVDGLGVVVDQDDAFERAPSPTAMSRVTSET
jgi:hypothetical protein